MMGPSDDLPYLLGALTPLSNNASLSTKGFEIALSWNDRISKDVTYNVRASLGDSRTKIISFKNESGLIDNFYAGKNYGEIWGYISEGLIQNAGDPMANQTSIFPTWRPGDMKYKDLNGENAINEGSRTINSHGDLTVIGNRSARYNFALSGGLTYKNFDFSMFWQGIGKQDYVPTNLSSMFWGMTNAFASSTILRNSPSLDYWRPSDETNLLGPNTDAYFAKPYFSAETNKNRQVQSKYILNGAYIRLKNVNLGYSLPQNIINKIQLQKARVYIAGENLLTFTKLPKIFDPETLFANNTGNSVQAVSRYLIMGVNVTF